MGWARDHCTGGTRGVGTRPLYGRHTWGGHETTVREAHVGWARDHCTGGTRRVGTRPLYSTVVVTRVLEVKPVTSIPDFSFLFFFD